MPNWIAITPWGLFVVTLFAWFTGLPGDYLNYQNARNQPIGAKVSLIAEANTFSMPPQLLNGVERINRLQDTSPELKAISEELAILDEINNQITMQIDSIGDQPAAAVFIQLSKPAIGYVDDDNDKRLRTFDEFTSKINIGTIRSGESVNVRLYFKSPIGHGDVIQVNYTGGNQTLQVTEFGIQTYSYQYELVLIFFGIAVAATIILTTQFGWSLLSRNKKAP